jgi:hypothetical protein
MTILLNIRIARECVHVCGLSAAGLGRLAGLFLELSQQAKWRDKAVPVSVER